MVRGRFGRHGPSIGQQHPHDLLRVFRARGAVIGNEDGHVGGRRFLAALGEGVYAVPTALLVQMS